MEKPLHMSNAVVSILTLLLILILSLIYAPSCLAASELHTTYTNKLPIVDQPQRIVVLPLFAEEMLLEMIGPDRIVGVGHLYYEGGEAYSPTMALTKHIQGGLTVDNVEGILAVSPDLVVLWEADFYRYETLLLALDHAGASVVFVKTPNSFDDVVDSLIMLGEVVNAQKEAAQMVEVVENGLAQLREIVSSIPENRRIRVTDYDADYRESAYGAIADAAAVVDSGEAVFTSKHTDYHQIDDQLLSEWNPDLITIRPFALDTDGILIDLGKEYVDLYVAQLLDNADLSTISAIQNQNIHPLGIYNSQYMLQSATDLARLAYPDLLTKQGQ